MLLLTIHTADFGNERVSIPELSILKYFLPSSSSSHVSELD